MRTSRRKLIERNANLGARLDKAIADRDTNGAALRRVSAELSDLKDEVALHIVAAKHPSSALSDAHSMAVSLQEALAALGVDLRIEVARLERSGL